MLFSSDLFHCTILSHDIYYQKNFLSRFTHVSIKKIKWPTQSAKLLELCLTVLNPMNCSPLGSSVHGIFQARILEWVAIPFSRRSTIPRGQTMSLKSPALAGGFFTTLAT